MKRFLSLLLALVMILCGLPFAAEAEEIDGEDPILEYGIFSDMDEAMPMDLMSSAPQPTFEMADIPEGEEYQHMTASQEIIDLIKDFEGFSSTPYWDNTQWTVGYGTRCSGPDVRVTRAEAEELLRKMLKNTFEPVVNSFCENNGKQPTQQQFDAMLDLTYNNGGSWTTGSAVPEVVLQSSTALDVVKGFGAWSRSGGKVSYVHVNRRIREALIYLYGEYYLAYGGQDCKSDLEVVSNDDLPRFKAVIFKTKSGTLDNGKSDYASYYPVGDYYRSFIEASRDGYTLVGWEITKRSNAPVDDDERISIWDRVEENLELTAVWEKGVFEVTPETPPEDYEEPTEPVPSEPQPTEPAPTEPAPSEPQPSEPAPSEPQPSEPEATEPVPSEPQPTEPLPFLDVPEGTWFTEAVRYVFAKGYMNGFDSTTFGPVAPMTRGMLVTVLHRLDGAEPVADELRSGFQDIAGQYYTDAIDWAYANKIVNGISDIAFEPNRTVTRQEAVTIFYRYCVNYKQLPVESGLKLEGFVDAEQVATWASDAFTWAVNVDLVEGYPVGDAYYLMLNDHLNRAQAAVLLQRCVEDIL